jgi:hypothetical protein
VSPPGAGPPFSRDLVIDEAGLAGARWWQEQLAVHTDPIARRTLLRRIALGAGIALAGGTGLYFALRDPEEDIIEADALAAQREHGWSFGAETEALAFGSAPLGGFDRGALARLGAELAPRQPRHVPLAVPTLFQALGAAPTGLPAAPVAPLAAALRPVDTPEMQIARRRGESLASLYVGAAAQPTVIVDLPGPEAVAFAAGLAERLEPVFLFDNWPHPRGVVPSHLTLAAAATLAPALVAAAAKRPHDAPAAFILDRSRLSPYTDEAERFDNRYLARTPPVAFLTGQGVTQLLCIVPTAADAESDDLVDDFVLYAAAGVDVKTVAATDFRQDADRVPPPVATTTPPPPEEEVVPEYVYGGRRIYHWSFWHFYRMGTPRRSFRMATNVSRGYAFRATARTTMFSRAGGGRLGGRPAGFGKVGTVRSGRGGASARFGGRSGSFGRGGRGGG